MTDSDDATTAAIGGVRPIRAVLTRLSSSLRRRRAALKTTAVALMLPLPLAFSAPPADLLGRFDASTGALSDLVRPFTSLLKGAEESAEADDGVRQVPMDLGSKLDSPRIDSGLGGDLRRPISGINSFDMPAPVMRAYRAAAATLARTDPSCRIDWALLAGIGRVESNHGQFGGSTVQPNGSTAPHIIGLPLNGAPGVATIRDSDGGRLDNDKVWDRAVGPMQFIPTTWASVAADGDNDGVRDPHDIDDAALAAGAYLCAGRGDLSTREGAEAAVFRYNHSESYVSLVLAIAEKYRNGVAVVPAGPPPVGNGKAPNLSTPPATTPSGDSGSTWRPKKKSGGGSTTPGGTPTSPPTGDPSDPPSSDPSDPPTTEPPPSQPPKPKLTTCAGGWCYGGDTISLGLAHSALLDQPEDANYDGASSTQTLREELNFLVTHNPTVAVGLGANGALESINGKAYSAPQPKKLTGKLQNSGGLGLFVGDKTWRFAPLSSDLPARDYNENNCQASVTVELEQLAAKEGELSILAVVDEGSTAIVTDIVTVPASKDEVPACGSDGQPVPAPSEEPSPTPSEEESTPPE
ncbi:MAG: lytic transglycosylase domain-containing protein [Nocardioidaceae bacterium]